MASVAPPVKAGRRPESVQPGGGWVMRLEQVWGRLRRAWLRRARPGYVRRMLAKRQGDCPNCPHDIIDPRDLKYVRNVCGYWFRPEADVYARREDLGFARWGYAELVGFATVLLAVGGLFLVATYWLPQLSWLFAIAHAATWLL